MQALDAKEGGEEETCVDGEEDSGLCGDREGVHSRGRGKLAPFISNALSICEENKYTHSMCKTR